MTLAATTDTLRVALENVAGFRLAETLTPGTPPGDGLGILEVESVNWDQTFRRGLDQITFDLTVVVPTSSPRTTLETLEGLLTGVKAAVEDSALVCQVVQASGFSTYSINGVEMYGCHVQVVVDAIA